MNRFTISAIAILTVSVSTASLASTLYVYRESDGTKWITDHRLPVDQYTFIEKYGRPTAVLSCRGRGSDTLDRRLLDVEPLITRYSRQFSLDEALVKAVIRVESCFDPLAESTVGAQGLMQLMPDTAKELGVWDRTDPEQNVRGGTEYLSRMLQAFDQKVEFALAAYNAGPQAVKKHRGIPPYRETQAYVHKVLAHYRTYAAAR